MTKQVTPAEPRTSPEAVSERVPGVNMAGAKADISPSIEVVAPAVESVVTGKHVLTGEPIVKERPLKSSRPAADYNTGDRRVYVAHTASTGSLNGRKFNFKAGEVINLNEDEYGIFKPYVNLASK